MIGKRGPFPELNSSAEGFEDNGYIRSSQSVGAGHEDYDGRDAISGKIAAFPNTETGEGKDDTPSKCGSDAMPDHA